MVTSPNTDAKACNQLQLPKLPLFAESPASCVGFFFCWALFFPGALMGAGGTSGTHAQYSTEPYGCMQKSLPYAMLLGVILHIAGVIHKRHQ